MNAFWSWKNYAIIVRKILVLENKNTVKDTTTCFISVDGKTNWISGFFFFVSYSLVFAENSKLSCVDKLFNMMSKLSPPGNEVTKAKAKLHLSILLIGMMNTAAAGCAALLLKA